MGTNLKMKRYYGIAKVKWQRQHGTMKFTASHMNYVLVDMWHSFQQQSASFIINAFKKSSYPLPHLIKTPMTKYFYHKPKLRVGRNQKKSKGFLGPLRNLEKSRPTEQLTRWSSLDKRVDHRGTSLFKLKFIILSNRGQLSPLNKSMQLRWK